MTKTLRLASLLALFLAGNAFAQESPSPSPSASPTPPAPEISTDTATPTPSPTPTPSAAPTRSVRISFLPPPLEGTISLGIFDRDGKLVRVLVEEGDVDEFEVGADALVMKWDGKNDKEEDLPAGKYRARGYMVGQLKVDELKSEAAPPADAPDHVPVKLVSNPLSKNAKLSIDLGVGFDEERIFLKTTDGLPLFTVIEAPELTKVGITKGTEKAVDIWITSGAGAEPLRVSNVDKMMAFDAGEIELK
jgi:hypothetical protein